MHAGRHGHIHEKVGRAAKAGDDDDDGGGLPLS